MLITFDYCSIRCLLYNIDKYSLGVEVTIYIDGISCMAGKDTRFVFDDLCSLRKIGGK